MRDTYIEGFIEGYIGNLEDEEANVKAGEVLMVVFRLVRDLEMFSTQDANEALIHWIREQLEDEETIVFEDK